MQGTVQLFSMEYLALGLVVSLFLVLGLSALGPIMIFGSMMLYGLGSGLLMVQLCTAGGWKTMLSAHTAGAVSADHGGTAAALRRSGRAFVSGQLPVNNILFLRVLVQCVTITKDHK